VAAFGRLANPVELFAAYGIANVAGALPITPAGLGVVDSIAPLLLVSFGVTRNVATLGVLAWRLVNFWLPIPAGALAYASLKVPSGAGWRAMRHAVSGMMSHGEPDHGSSGHPDGQAVDNTAPAGKPTADDPANPAGDGSDPAGGPARGDFRVG
jgi:lysylphosphatidylglycerol synthase-like protein